MDLQKKIEAFDEKLMQHLPAIDDAEVFVDGVIEYLFPIRAKIRNAPVYTELKEQILKRQWENLLLPLTLHLKSPIDELSKVFFEELGHIFDQLKDDAQAILDFDPASVSLEEVLVAYPGFYAVAVYRVAHCVHTLNIPFIPRLLTEYAHSKTGIDIHPGARIGRRFFIDHGTGVVIGETTEIGNEVKIYQGVTLGRTSGF
jgi:serine O-acetyltransferase